MINRTNFHFLTGEWTFLLADAKEAEKSVLSAPRTSAFYSRRILENGVKWLYKNDEDLEDYDTYKKTVYQLMHNPDFRAFFNNRMFKGMDYVRIIGNNAVHKPKQPSEQEAFQCLLYAYDFVLWLVRAYTEADVPLHKFDPNLLPKSQQTDMDLQAIKKLEGQLQAKDKKLQEKDQLVLAQGKKLQQSEEEIARLKAILAKNKAIRTSHRTLQDPQTLSEAETRKNYIDLWLKEAGWDIESPLVSLEYEVTGMPISTNKSGKGYVDYVLWGDNGKPLAVIEAKRTLKDARVGKTQAKLYADCLEKMTGQRPFIFYTNGFETWLWDDEFYPPRDIFGFYRKEDLEKLLNRRSSRKELSSTKINHEIAGRYYQERAIRKVTDVFNSKHRKALLVMATGSGKTRTAAALSDLLTKTNWAKRVLFLADRNALVTQAKNDFKDHLSQLIGVDITKEKSDETSRLIFSTYPTMMNRIDSVEDKGQRRYGVGHFDLIIIDEAHRSIYKKYQAIFEYFDALLLGLTATPKEEIDKNTYEVFDLSTKAPTDFYDLPQAVTDGYLVPPKAYSVDLGFPQRGINYDALSEEQKEIYERTFLDNNLPVPHKIPKGKINSFLFNEDTVDKVLTYLMENGEKIEGGDKLGKTIIFTKNHQHALYVEERFNKIFPQYKGNFLQIIDNYDPKAQDLIDKFKVSEKYPQIAVSVDMMDTGINVPEIVNLVFFKPVHSKSKFWQMIGRGTRLCPDLFGPNQDKTHFNVYDFCGNLQVFNIETSEETLRNTDSLSQRIFKVKLNITEALKEREDEALKALHKKYLDDLYKEVNGLNDQNILVRKQLKYVEAYRKDRKIWDDLNKVQISEIFQYLSPLAQPKPQDDEKSRRFDYLNHQLQLAILQGSKRQQKFLDNIQNLCHQLTKKAHIPSIQDKITLLNKTKNEGYWKQISLAQIEEIRDNLRHLISLLDKDKQKIIYTKLEDEIGETQEIDIITDYPQAGSCIPKITKFVKENKHQLVISKIINNKAISQAELLKLEELIFDGTDRGTKQDFIDAYGTEKPLVLFIRNLLGMDVHAAKEAFADFLNQEIYSSDQIDFINKIIDALTQKGVIDPEQLFEVPFLDIHDEGITGVFEHNQATKIISIIEDINGKVSFG